MIAIADSSRLGAQGRPIRREVVNGRRRVRRSEQHDEQATQGGVASGEVSGEAFVLQ